MEGISITEGQEYTYQVFTFLKGEPMEETDRYQVLSSKVMALEDFKVYDAKRTWPAVIKLSKITNYLQRGPKISPTMD